MNEPSDRQIDAATDAYLKARGFTDEQLVSHTKMRSEVRERMVAALKAAEDVKDAT